MKDKYETAQLEIQHHEGNFFKVSKELKTLQERFDLEVTKNMDGVNASNEERMALKETIKEGKEEIAQLMKQINETKLVQ